MNAKIDSYHMLLNARQNDPAIQKVILTITCSRSKGPLGVTFDNKLKFDSHNERVSQRSRKK